MIEMTMKLGDDRELTLGADTMNEMVDKIKEWQDWETFKGDLASFNKDTPKRLKEEKASGWYYFPKK